MVFKIRDKSLFWTKSGWKNNWEPKILNMPKAINPITTQYISSPYNHHSFIRMYQAYRNYSRLTRQYLYGDKLAEQAVILEIRSQFKIPYTCQTPVELIKHGAERRFADQLDRDLQLISHNYHPGQLFTYEVQNKRIRLENQERESKQKGEKTFNDAVLEEIQQILSKNRLQVGEEEKKLAPGERISLEKMTEILLRVARSARAAQGVKPTRREDGEFNDFLEKRRPFLNPNPTGNSH